MIQVDACYKLFDHTSDLQNPVILYTCVTYTSTGEAWHWFMDTNLYIVGVVCCHNFFNIVTEWYWTFMICWGQETLLCL